MNSNMSSSMSDSEQTRCRSNSIAIIGMSCIFPGASGIEQFWNNIISGVDSIREAGPEEWDAGFYKNKSSSSFGKVYCTRGGFITEYAEFDPLEFGIMPSSLRGSDPDQFIALRAAAEALADAGYSHKTFDGERAEIILGRTSAPGVGSLNLIQHGQTVDQVMDILKATSPHLDITQLQKIEQGLRAGLQPCNADTIPAVMPNVLSGRIASKLGFRGRNLVLDAACASSLTAVEMAMQSLLSGQSDFAIAGGVHINSSPYFYQMFCELGALSATGVIRPFDESADGTILGEGVGMIVLKRLEDAERDNNRIYAVLKGIGSSSDGRGGGSLAPSVDGEALAMRRAYEMAGISPRTVELLEAHGTGTRAGDLAEMKAVGQVFSDSESKAEPGKKAVDENSAWCAIGSVKSMIGHTQAASGVAGLIKAALALHHRILPQTLNVAKPNTQIDWKQSPCYVNTKTHPWESSKQTFDEPAHPRRAAVSAFGFGGVNAHAVLEEYCEQSAKSENQNSKHVLPANTASKSERMVKLSLRYPALSARSLDGLQLHANASESRSEQRVRTNATQADPNPQANPQVNPILTRESHSENPAKQFVAAATKAIAATSAPQLTDQYIDPQTHSLDDGETVVNAYLNAMRTFHQNLSNVQEKVMLSYLDDENQGSPPKGANS